MPGEGCGALSGLRGVLSPLPWGRSAWSVSVHGVAHPSWSLSGGDGGMLPGISVLVLGCYWWALGHGLGTKPLKQTISSQEGRAAFPAPLPLPWQWFPRRCQLPAYIRMFESLFLFWRAGALPPIPPTSLGEQGRSAPLAGTCPSCTSICALQRSPMIQLWDSWELSSCLAPMLVCITLTPLLRLILHQAPSVGTRVVGREGSGAASLLPVPLPKCSPPRGHQ